MSVVSGASRAAVELSPLVSRRRRRPPPAVLLAAAVLGTIVVCAAFGPLIAPRDPAAQDLLGGLQGPSAEHPLGTDDSGRDILSRLIVGARAAVVGPLLVMLGAALIGTVLGLAAGYKGGWGDAIIMRGVDVLYALPALLVAIVLVGVIGGGYFSAVGILILVTAPLDTRIVRSAALEQRALPYVDAARTLGLTPRTVMYRHVLPNVLPLIVANAFLNFAYSLVALSSLSFLGLGVPPGAADWGQMLSENLTFIESNAWAALAPGIGIVLVAVSMNLLGDWSYERLASRGSAR